MWQVKIIITDKEWGTTSTLCTSDNFDNIEEAAKYLKKLVETCKFTFYYADYVIEEIRENL